MKTASTYGFMFVPMPPSWFSPKDENNSGALRWPGRELQQCEASALPNHLFWPWFVDNPRRNLH